MKNLTFLAAVVLIAIGLVGYFGWEAMGAAKQSMTALIPAAVGVLMLVAALLAGSKPAQGLRLALIFAVLGALAGLGRIIPSAMKDGLDFSAASTQLITAMTATCVLYALLAMTRGGPRRS